MRRKVRAVFIALALAATSVRAQSTPVDTAPVVRGQVLHRNMSAGRSATFALRVDSGEFVRVIVETRGFHADFTVISPAGERLLSIEGMVDERQIVPVEARSTGTYRLVVASSGPVVGDGRYTVEASSVTRSALAAEADSIRGWLQGHSVGLKRVLPNAPYDDLLPLIHALRGVRVIGLGESTHGTHEYRVMAHRLFAFLATRMNVRVFAIESSYPSVLAINKYVLSGVGDPAEALAGQGYWITNTEEVLDLIRWMRRFNEKLPEARKLHFMGIDMVHTRLAVEALTEYLRKFGPYKLLELERVAGPLLAWAGAPDKSPPPDSAAWSGAVHTFNELFGFLGVHEAALVRVGGREAFDTARWHARILAEWADEVGDEPSPTGTRDAHMADNLIRHLDAMGSDTRAVIFAHNGHIAGTTDLDHTSKSRWAMGTYLRTRLGSAYYALGMYFSDGKVWARTIPPRGGPLKVHQIWPAPLGSGEWYLTQVPTSPFFIDFRSTTGPAVVQRWLASQQPMRSIGAGYPAHTDSLWHSSFGTVSLKDSYDGIIFFKHTTAVYPSSVPTRP